MELTNFYNNQVSFRLPDEIRERLVNVYPQIAGTENSIPMKEFFTKVCENAIEAIILKEEMAGFKASISSLQAENKILAEKTVELDNELKTKLTEIAKLKDIQNNEFNQILKFNEQIKIDFEALKVEKNRLLDQLAGFNSQSSENQIIIDLTAPEKAVMDEITKRETERTKKQITPEIIFRDLFNTYMVKGASDVFPRIPDSDLAVILKQFKK